MTGKLKASTAEDVNRLCPPGSQENAWFRMTVGYWDMVSGFITAGVLNADLFFQSAGELGYTYERIRGAVPELRAVLNYPSFLANYEKVADMYLEWLEKQHAGSAAAFQARAKA
jgi:hypothetical protein